MPSAAWSITWSPFPVLRVEEDRSPDALELGIAPWPRHRFLTRYVGTPAFCAVMVLFPALLAWSGTSHLGLAIAGAVAGMLLCLVPLLDVGALLQRLSFSRSRAEVKVEWRLFDCLPWTRTLRAADVGALEVAVTPALRTDAGGELRLDVSFKGNTPGRTLLRLPQLFVVALDRPEEALDLGLRVACTLGLERYFVESSPTGRHKYRFVRAAGAGLKVPDRLGRSDYAADRVAPVPDGIPLAALAPGDAPSLDRAAWVGEPYRIERHDPGRYLQIEKAGEPGLVVFGYCMIPVFAIIGLAIGVRGVVRGDYEAATFLLFSLSSPAWYAFVLIGRPASVRVDRSKGVVLINEVGVPMREIVAVELQRHEGGSSSGGPGGGVGMVGYQVAIRTRRGKCLTLAYTWGRGDEGAVCVKAHALAAAAARIVGVEVKQNQ